MRISRPSLVLLSAAMIGLAPGPVQASHGTEHFNLHFSEAGGSSYYAKAHSGCSASCDFATAEMRYEGSWLGRTCNFCGSVYSPQRVVGTGNRGHRHHIFADPHQRIAELVTYLP